MADQGSELVCSRTTAFAADVFALDVIKKAAYPFTDRASFEFRASDDKIEVDLNFAPAVTSRTAAGLLADFKNEVLEQDLRRSIAEETAPMRNAILGYALSRTGLLGE
jgi:His-Xaa-Ser system protein HxsD